MTTVTDRVADARLVFEPGLHQYFLDGEHIPSVTQTLQASGLIDFSHVPEPIIRAAQERGTKVHQAVHYFNEKDLDLEAFNRDFPAYAGYVGSWERLYASGRLKTLTCELRVASPMHRYAGTIDWLGWFDERPAILDFATGHPHDVAKDLQTAAYERALGEWCHMLPADLRRKVLPFVDGPIDRYSVRLKKSGELPTPIRYKQSSDFSKFRSLLEAQYIVKARKPRAINWQEWEAA